MMTREEFEAAYASRSGITIQQLREHGRIAVPCMNCDYEKCEGWKMVNRKEYDEDIQEFLQGKGPHP